jgi:hypothetical protein
MSERLMKETRKLRGRGELTERRPGTKGIGSYLVKQRVLTYSQWAKFARKYPRGERSDFWPDDYTRALSAMFPDIGTDIRIAMIRHSREVQ